MDTSNFTRITNIGIADGAVTDAKISNLNDIYMIGTGLPAYQEYARVVAIEYEELTARRFSAIDKARLLVYDKLVEQLRKDGYPDGTYIVDFSVTQDSDNRTVRVCAFTRVDIRRRYEKGSQVMPLARDTSYKAPDKVEGELRVRRNIIITGEK